MVSPHYTQQKLPCTKEKCYCYAVVPILANVRIYYWFCSCPKTSGLDKSQSDLVLLKLVKQTFNPWVVGIIGAAGVLTALVPVL